MQMVLGPRAGSVERSATGMTPSLLRMHEEMIRGPQHSRAVPNDLDVWCPPRNP